MEYLAMEYREISFSALWDYSEEIKNNNMDIKTANKHCLSMRNKMAKQYRHKGYTVRSFTIKGELREYWSLGCVCGLWCPSYFIEVSTNKLRTNFYDM